MKDFADVLSPRSWLFLIAGFFPMYLIVFSPNIWEILVFHVVEFLGIQAIAFADKRLFRKCFPATSAFFPSLDIATLESLPFDEKQTLFKTFVRFPQDRARFCALLSVPKVLVVSSVVVFYWQHDCSNLMQFLKFIAVEAVMLSYFYGALFIELHDLVSRKLALIHQTYDWTEVFKHAPTPDYRGHFETQERSAFLAAWIFMMWGQWLVIMDQTLSSTVRGIQITVIALAAGLLMTRMWQLSRAYFFGGLTRIFDVLDSFRPETIPNTLPLHSSHLLARFGQVFNQLVDRLHRYERELSHWIFFRTEQSRYRALGEISGLIVHDLTGPLHVVQFCSQQLKDDPAKVSDSRYLDQLATSSARSLELVNSLRAYLQNPKQTQSQVRYHEVEPHIFRLLEAQYSDKGLPRVRFVIDPLVRDCPLLLTAADLIHVMLNLFSNSIQNLLQNNIPNPTVKVSMVEVVKESATIAIEDNGTGLSLERYEQLTAFAYLPQKKRMGTYDGLGLRLIRRLVERNNGTLTVIDRPNNEKGTLFHLRLDCMQEWRLKESSHEVTQAHLDH